MLLYPSAWMQIIIILGAGLLGLTLFKEKAESNVQPFSINISKKAWFDLFRYFNQFTYFTAHHE